MFYVEISNGKITGKGSKNINALNENEKEISAEIFDQLVRLPADFVADGDGNIISVTNAPEPEPQPTPPTTEERLAAVEMALLILME